MNDNYIYGTPDGIDEDELKQMQAMEDAIKVRSRRTAAIYG